MNEGKEKDHRWKIIIIMTDQDEGGASSVLSVHRNNVQAEGESREKRVIDDSVCVPHLPFFHHKKVLPCLCNLDLSIQDDDDEG
jgi:hypothetical protein